MAAGAYFALRELAGLYEGALNDPLGQPVDAEKHTSDQMIRGVLIGACGIPPFLLGVILVKASLIRRLTGARGR